jgi:predicted ester cyclase
MIPQPLCATYFDALAEKDVERAAATLSGDLVFVTPVEAWDKDTLVRLLTALFEGFPDWRFDHGELRREGDTVSTTLSMSGTHTGTFDPPVPGVKARPPTGRRVELPAQDFHYRVEDGKIVHVEPDPVPHAGLLGLLEQLGVRLPPLWVMRAVARLRRLLGRS